jgi:UDP-glucuronate 4-epimerase
MALFKFVSAMLEDRPIDVYGYGEMRRDFTYIDDLIAAIVALMALPPVAGRALSTASRPWRPTAAST